MINIKNDETNVGDTNGESGRDMMKRAIMKHNEISRK